MYKEISLVFSPETAADPAKYEKIIADRLQVSKDQIASIRIVRKSIDARGTIKVNMSFHVFLDQDTVEDRLVFDYKDVSSAKEVVIVGSGPAGLFAALRLIELGFRPIVLERGKDVSSRKVDIADINKNQPINPDSNYCFGEGGAGTYSDGKLFTRSKKRGNHRRALEIFYNHGAAEAILYEAHPHIGTEVLPGIIKSIREQIISFGGSVVFDCRITDLILEKGEIKGVINQKGESFKGIATILATGHSARDIYELLHAKKVALEAKSFAMGVRVEHPQGMIDSIQYNMPYRGDCLPAASYALVSQISGRGVYSFCMCPGGFIVPSATMSNESVVNGMSPSGRNSLFANSGIVTEIRPSDYAHLEEQYGVLAGLKFQEAFEQTAFDNGGGMQMVPAQRLADFTQGKLSSNLPKSSYIPGVHSSDMNTWMPNFISSSLRGGFAEFGKKMKGFLTNEAMILGVESRTSSPVRIPRNTETLEHIEIKRLFPCGEGAGYSGGIISSAVDGERIAEAISVIYKK